MRPVLSGPLKGVKLPLDLRTEFQIYIGTWERETHAALQRLSEGACTVIDVGASSGPISLFALAKTNARSVLAFEPQVSLHGLIHQALEANNLKAERFDVLPYFVGNTDDMRTRKLDSFAESVCYPCFIKIDVEGAELDVLKGARTVLEGDTCLLIETHSKSNELKCIDFLKDLGFETAILDTAWWRVVLPEQRPLAHNRWLAAWKPGHA